MLVRFQPGLPSIFNRQIWRILYLAPVAQRIRALVFGTRCHRFESCRVYHNKKRSACTSFFVGTPSIRWIWDFLWKSPGFEPLGSSNARSLATTAHCLYPVGCTITKKKCLHFVFLLVPRVFLLKILTLFTRVTLATNIIWELEGGGVDWKGVAQDAL